MIKRNKRAKQQEEMSFEEREALAVRNRDRLIPLKDGGWRVNPEFYRELTQKEYDFEKDRLIEKVILHLRHPNEFELGCFNVTFEEVALLISPDKDHVQTKMNMCKIQKIACLKMKEALKRFGITCLEDVLDTNKGRRVAYNPHQTYDGKWK